MFGMEFYVDPSRCIGCQACLKACEECDTHRGISMINFDFVDRKERWEKHENQSTRFAQDGRPAISGVSG